MLTTSTKTKRERSVDVNKIPKMKFVIPKLPFALSLFFSLSLLLVFFFSFPLTSLRRPVSSSSPSVTVANEEIRIRHGYTSYEAYIQHQLNKTQNPKLRKVWTTRDWDRKVRVFSTFFQRLSDRGLISNGSKALSIGARVGQEVAALRLIGVEDSIGLDLVPRPPLVVKGDFHAQPFDAETFDFEFSNVFDHALYPEKFVGEIERTLKPGGVCVIHVSLHGKTDKYSANDLYSVKPLVKLFKRSKVVEVREIDGFGLDTEIVFRKNKD